MRSASWSKRHAARWGLAANDFWRTPPEVFAALDAEFLFTLDAAASEDDHLVPWYLTPEDDALSADWSAHAGERPGSAGAYFVNPPYSGPRAAPRSAGLAEWLKTAEGEAHAAGCPVVALVPAAFGSPWFRLAVERATEIRIYTRRLAFIHPDTGERQAGSRHSSAAVIYRPWEPRGARVRYIDPPSTEEPCVLSVSCEEDGAGVPSTLRGVRPRRPLHHC